MSCYELDESICSFIWLFYNNLCSRVQVVQVGGAQLQNQLTDITMDGTDPHITALGILPNLPIDTTMDGGTSQHAHQQKNLFRNPRGTLPLGVTTGMVAVYRVLLENPGR